MLEDRIHALLNVARPCFRVLFLQPKKSTTETSTTRKFALILLIYLFIRLIEAQIVASLTHTHRIDPTKGLKDAAKGKVVLITGASRGLGPHMCVAYAQAGAEVVAMGARTVKGLKETADKVRAANPDTTIIELELDVSNLESCNKAIEKVVEQAGRIDVLVNNAGISELWVDLIESDPLEWWQTHEVNQKGTWFMTRLTLPHLLKNPASKTGKKGTIVNVASLAGIAVVPTASSYGISKTAMIRLTEFVDAELGDQGIVCIAIHPCAAESKSRASL